MITRASSLALLLVLTAQPAFAEWVSVAVNRGKGTHGFSAVGADRKTTMEAAVIVCNKNSGRKDGCFNVLSSEQCLTLAQAGVQMWARDAETKEQSQTAALEACREVGGDRCKVVRTRCAN